MDFVVFLGFFFVFKPNYFNQVVVLAMMLSATIRLSIGSLIHAALVLGMVFGINKRKRPADPPIDELPHLVLSK